MKNKYKTYSVINSRKKVSRSMQSLREDVKIDTTYSATADVVHTQQTDRQLVESIFTLILKVVESKMTDIINIHVKSKKQTKWLVLRSPRS